MFGLFKKKQLPEEVKADAEAKFLKFCEKRVPENIRDELRISFRIKNSTIILLEERPFFKDPDQWTALEVAMFRYENEKWQLYWQDRYDKWNDYEINPTNDLQELLKEVDQDPTGIFWG